MAAATAWGPCFRCCKAGRRVEGLFAPLQRDWTKFDVNAEEFVTEGDRIIGLGKYAGTHRHTGRSVTAPFAHHWTVRGDRIVRFVQYTDTAKVLEAMRP